MNSVLSKKQSYRLWRDGIYGNKLRSWRTVGEWQRSGFRGPVALRCLGRAGGGPCIYDVVPGQVWLAVERMHQLGVLDGEITLDEMAPADETILQGEYLNAVREDGRWGHFFYSLSRLPMRTALFGAGVSTSGLRADLLIRGAMTPASYEDWRELLESYPDHVFEVSIYDRCVGDLPHRNALVWEVRKY